MFFIVTFLLSSKCLSHSYSAKIMPTLQSPKNGAERAGRQLGSATENATELSENKGVII